MKKPELVVGHLMSNELFVKSIPTSKHLDWLKWLETDELVEFFAELFKLITQISEGKKDADTLTIFLSGWRETALINSEPDVLADIAEAERELDAGGGKPWSQIKGRNWAVNRQPYTLEPLPRKVENFIKRRDRATQERINNAFAYILRSPLRHENPTTIKPLYGRKKWPLSLPDRRYSFHLPS